MSGTPRTLHVVANFGICVTASRRQGFVDVTIEEPPHEGGIAFARRP